MNYSFKRSGICGMLLILCLISTTVYAETMYVSDNLKLTLRTGPSTQNKILSVIESGQMMEVVRLGDEWSQVQLPNGKSGWVLSRYLTVNEPHRIKLERLQVKHKNLMAQAVTLLEDNNRLKAENKQLKSESATNQGQLLKTRKDYETLKSESAKFLTVKTNYERAASQLGEETARAKKLEDQLAKLEMNHAIKWFLAGSAVLIAGFLIGFSTKRQRRRPSLV